MSETQSHRPGFVAVGTGGYCVYSAQFDEFANIEAS